MFHEFKARNVTTRFGKMEATVDFAKNSLSGAMVYVGAKLEEVGRAIGGEGPQNSMCRQLWGKV